MSSQKKRKIKIVTIHDSFFTLVKDTEPELLQIRKKMQRRPCLVLLKLNIKKKSILLRYLYVQTYLNLLLKAHIFLYPIANQQG